MSCTTDKQAALDTKAKEDACQEVNRQMNEVKSTKLALENDQEELKNRCENERRRLGDVIADLEKKLEAETEEKKIKYDKISRS